MSKFGTRRGAVGSGPKPFNPGGGGKTVQASKNVTQSRSNNAPKGGGRTKVVSKPGPGSRGY